MPPEPLGARPRAGSTALSGTIHIVLSPSPPHTQVEELRKQIEVLSQNHEREVDRKDALLQVCACIV